MTATKGHAAMRGPIPQSVLSKKGRANYTKVLPGEAGSKNSAGNAALNAEMLRGGCEPRVSVTPAQAAALKASGSRTY